MSLLDLPSTYHRLTAVRAEVDVGALRHNVRVLRERAGAAELIGVVKADAYGHGAVPVTRILASEGVRRFAVSSVPEGIELREAGIAAPILVLGAPLPEYLPAYARYRLQVTVSSPDVAAHVVEAAGRSGPLTAHVKVDTGMHRIGVDPDDVPDVIRALRSAPGVDVEGIMTHFANVDRLFTMQQLGRFDAVLAALGADAPPHIHVSNSGTLLRVPETIDGRTDVRVGGALYGLLTERVDSPEVAEMRLRPAMRLVSRVVHVQEIEAGESVSYGRMWTAAERSLIATIAAGYGDGLPRGLSPAGSVGVGGRLYPIAGRVCMDMLMLDLGAPDGPGSGVRVGDEAVIFGPGGPSALEAAVASQSIAYALTSGLTARVPRVYVGDLERTPESHDQPRAAGAQDDQDGVDAGPAEPDARSGVVR
jgi:alanine racemase